MFLSGNVSWNLEMCYLLLVLHVSILDNSECRCLEYSEGVCGSDVRGISKSSSSVQLPEK
jgi:hypothetical protein